MDLEINSSIQYPGSEIDKQGYAARQEIKRRGQVEDVDVRECSRGDGKERLQMLSQIQWIDEHQEELVGRVIGLAGWDLWKNALT